MKPKGQRLPRLRKFIAWVVKAFTGLDKELKDNIAKAIYVTQKIKEAVNSPEAEIIVDWIPGQWDNVAKDIVERALDVTLTALGIIDTCQNEPDWKAKLKCYIQQIRLRTHKSQNSDLSKFASTLVAEIDGNRFPEHFYDTNLQLGFSSTKDA